jgi:hypothetical protein
LSRVGLRCDSLDALRDGWLLLRVVEVAADASVTSVCGHPAPKRPCSLGDAMDVYDVLTDMLTALGVPLETPLFRCTCGTARLQRLGLRGDPLSCCGARDVRLPRGVDTPRPAHAHFVGCCGPGVSWACGPPWAGRGEVQGIPSSRRGTHNCRA